MIAPLFQPKMLYIQIRSVSKSFDNTLLRRSAVLLSMKMPQYFWILTGNTAAQNYLSVCFFLHSAFCLLEFFSELIEEAAALLIVGVGKRILKGFELCLLIFGKVLRDLDCHLYIVVASVGAVKLLDTLAS